MPALFRIVQDDYPPLPEGVSPALKDWLMQCFQKDPVLRISAQKLLNHKWIKAKRKDVIPVCDGGKRKWGMGVAEEEEGRREGRVVYIKNTLVFVSNYYL